MSSQEFPKQLNIDMWNENTLHYAKHLSFVNCYYDSDKIITDKMAIKESLMDKFILMLSTDYNVLGRMIDQNTAVHKSSCDDIIIDITDMAGNSCLACWIAPQHNQVMLVGSPSEVSYFFDNYSDFVGYDTRDEDHEIYIANYYLNEKDQIQRGDINKWCSDFDYIEDALYPKINVPALIENYISSDENILILNGVPGTGKTTMIKKVMQSIANFHDKDVTIGYVKDKAILDKNEFWAMAAGMEYDVLVFDDLDDALLPRDENSSDFVSNLLSFSDGVFDVSTKIVITSNHDINEVDTAIIRPGRCFDILDMPCLERQEAENVWTKIFKMKDFNETFGDLDEISQAFVHSEYKRIKSELPKDYLKDQSISIRNKFMK